MPHERFYVPEALIPGQTVVLEDQEFHHLAHVMRGKPGERIELVNGQGDLANATIESMGKKQAALHVDDAKSEPAPAFEIVLAQAIPRLNRLDFILEKGTELGMTQLWLFPAQHSERKDLTSHQLERMQAVIISAMKQCGRLYLPQIMLKPVLKQWQTPNYSCYFGDVDPHAPAYRPETFDEGILFFIGPESGFTDEEVQILRKMSAKGVKLHPNILRTDTAALAALTLISQQLI